MTLAPGSIPLWRLPLAKPPRVLVLARVHQTGTDQHRRLRWRQPAAWGFALMDGHGSIADAAGGWRADFRPGSICTLPPGAEVDLEFRPGCAQWELRFAPVGRAGAVDLPAVAHAADGLPPIERVLRQAIAVHATDPDRAAAAAWHLLHEIAAHRRATAAPEASRLLAAALTAAASHPSGQPPIAWLARRAGCSVATLGRIFRDHLGMPPQRYFAAQRAERARDLLTGTALPIAEVAALCGLHDIQHFNKFVRRLLGGSPSAVRARGAAMP